MAPTITLVVMGNGPRLVPCMRIAAMLRDALKGYAKLRILFMPSSIEGIQVEDAGLVECIDEEEALEKLIDMCARIAINMGSAMACAAGVVRG
ncbi:MAG: hypothetical protein GXO32_07780 [Crenarchaeota archaeon]|nr:hypothetical protein [Thermoproteota archaeon]